MNAIDLFMFNGTDLRQSRAVDAANKVEHFVSKCSCMNKLLRTEVRTEVNYHSILLCFCIYFKNHKHNEDAGVLSIAYNLNIRTS